MKCASCYKNLDENTIYCDKCGTTTNVLATKLSFKKAFNNVKEKIGIVKNKNFSLFITLILLAFYPAIIGSVTLANRPFLVTTIVTLLVPFLLIPLTRETSFLSSPMRVKEYFSLLKHYPKMFVFVFSNYLFFFILHFICTLEPFLYYAYDPILNLVEVVMFFYWWAVIIPAFGLMTKKKMNPFKAIYVGYKVGLETRWQQFFIAMTIAGIVILGTLTAGITLLFTLPYVYGLLEEYYQQMDDCKMFADFN